MTMYRQLYLSIYSEYRWKIHAANEVQHPLGKFCKPVRDYRLRINFMICKIMGYLKYIIFRPTSLATFSNPIRYFSEESIVIPRLITEKIAVSELFFTPDLLDGFLVLTTTKNTLTLLKHRFFLWTGSWFRGLCLYVQVSRSSRQGRLDR